MRDPAARPLLRWGLVCILVFLAAAMLVHLLNWREPPRHVSTYHHLYAGWLWNVGLAGLGAGTILLVAGLRRGLDVRGPATWAFRALEGAGLLIGLMILFPTDRNLNAASATTLGGYIHDSCAVLSTFLICWGMLLMVAAARVDPAWAGVPGRSWLWPAATITLALAWMGGDLTLEYWNIAAVVQRGVVLVMVAWLVAVGSRALSAQAAATGMPQPVPPPRPTR